MHFRCVNQFTKTTHHSDKNVQIQRYHSCATILVICVEQSRCLMREALMRFAMKQVFPQFGSNFQLMFNVTKHCPKCSFAKVFFCPRTRASDSVHAGYTPQEHSFQVKIPWSNKTWPGLKSHWALTRRHVGSQQTESL